MAPKGRKLDYNAMAQAKAMFDSGSTIAEIMDLTGRSRPTISDWLKRMSDPEFVSGYEAEKGQTQELIKDNMWRVVNKLVLQLEKAVDKGEVEPKDLGINLDKILRILAMREAKAPPASVPSLTLNMFGGDDAGEPGGIPDTEEIPSVEREISGDDNRIGGR
jgi:hypothetical protein